MNNTEQVEWRWHRLEKTGRQQKSHLVRVTQTWPDSDKRRLVRACGLAPLYTFGPNNDMTDPCKRCLRASAGKVVGKG